MKSKFLKRYVAPDAKVACTAATALLLGNDVRTHLHEIANTCTDVAFLLVRNLTLGAC